MKLSTIVAVSALIASSSALAGFNPNSANFVDSQNDLFDNGFGNLDITNVYAEYVAAGSYVHLAVTTREFSNWTKYCVFVDLGAGETATSNPWGRPHDTSGQGVTHFLGSWVDQASSNVQQWAFGGGSWANFATGNNSVYGNTVHLYLDDSGFALGSTIRFDVGTSGGGNDPMVDLLSRSDQATSGWGTGSVSGNFLTLSVPAPGAIALLGVAGLVSRRRR